MLFCSQIAREGLDKATSWAPLKEKKQPYTILVVQDAGWESTHAQRLANQYGFVHQGE